MRGSRWLLCAALLATAVPARGQGNHPPCNEADSLALVALYNALGGEDWKYHTNWLQPGRWVRSWYGVDFEGDLTDRVVALGLHSNNLVGDVPEALGDLTELERLRLYDNAITSLPESMGNLKRLDVLNLSNNQLTALPNGMYGMTGLRYLYLNDNQISGSVPTILGALTELEELGLANNRITRIPSELTLIAGLAVLNLGGNALAGTLDDHRNLGAMANLVHLNLRDNELGSELPEWLSQLGKLEELDLRFNAFSGEIPFWFSRLSRLRTLLLTGNAFTGEVPVSLTFLPRLTSLYLQINDLNDLPEFRDFYEDASPYTCESRRCITSSELKLWNNAFSFDDIVPNVGKASTVQYAPQYTLGRARDVYAEPGESISVSAPLGRGADYVWYENGVVVPGSGEGTHWIRDVTSADSGKVYVAEATHPGAPGLTLTARPRTLHVVPSRYDIGAVVIVAVEGEVLRSSGDHEWVDVSPGSSVAIGDELNTGLDSHVTVSVGGGRRLFRLGELTLIKVGEFTQGGDWLKTRLLLRIGELEAQIPGQKTVLSDFSVSTPASVASVRGTSFSVAHDTTTGITTVVVADGQVVVKPIAPDAGKRRHATQDSVMVDAWHMVQVSASGLGAVAPYSPAGIEVTPTEVTVPAGATHVFSASAWNGDGLRTPIRADWTADGGSIDSLGGFVAPAVDGTYTVSAMEPVSGLSATAIVTVTGGSGVTVEEEPVLEPLMVGSSYPNPAAGRAVLPLSLRSSAEVEIRVYDLLGRVVNDASAGVLPAGPHEVRIETGSLPPGLYFVRVRCAEFEATRPLVVIR